MMKRRITMLCLTVCMALLFCSCDYLQENFPDIFGKPNTTANTEKTEAPTETTTTTEKTTQKTTKETMLSIYLQETKTF